MIADELAAYPNWKTTIALKIPFLLPRLGILIGFGFMGFYSALAVFLMLRAGPQVYADALKSQIAKKFAEEEVAQ
jgi:TRAP-type C4-dicarboxylate transport system permease small subunit